MRAFAVIVSSLGVLVACSGQRAAAPDSEVPGIAANALPIEDYRDAADRGERVYCIDADESLVTIYVYRDGPLARMGHDHVVASRDVRGFAVVANEVSAARADLTLALEAMSVDEAALRDEAGFESAPSAEDIAGTRANMLASLEAETYPDIDLHATLMTGKPEARLAIDLRLHGVTQSFDVPVVLLVAAEQLEVSGSFSLQQTQFGITPYSVFGGALSVADQLQVFFRLRAPRCYSVDSTTGG